MSAPGGLHVFAGYGLDVVMGVTLLLPKRFPLGGDSQGMVMNPILGGWDLDGRGSVWPGYPQLEEWSNRPAS